MQSNSDIQRFVDAQIAQSEAVSYETAKLEISAGHKKTHWIWYILPQLRSLGTSQKAKKYGIKNIDEACEYLDNEVLFNHYNELIGIIEQKLDQVSVERLMGTDIDARKLVASLTLFRGASYLKFESKREQKYQDLAISCDAILKKITKKASYSPCALTLSVLDEYKAQQVPQALRVSANPHLPEDEKQKLFSQQVMTVVDALDNYIKLRNNEPSYLYQGLFKGYKKIDKIKAAFALRVKLKALTETDKELERILVANALKIDDLLKRDTNRDFAILDQGRLGLSLRRIATDKGSNSWYKTMGAARNYPRTVIGMIQYFLNEMIKFCNSSSHRHHP